MTLRNTILQLRIKYATKKSDRKLRERNIIVNIKYLRAHKYLIKNMI